MAQCGRCHLRHFAYAEQMRHILESGREHMSILRVHGGVPLKGDITVRGAKNFVSKAMVAAMLGESPTLVRNVPDIKDVQVVSDLLNLHGAAVSWDKAAGTVNIDPSNVESANRIDIDAHAGSSRIPILMCGPLLHRLGEAFIPDLGGCHIGDRPIDFHLAILREFGATVDKLESGVWIKAPARGLRGSKITLPYPSVGATEQLLLTAVRSEEHTSELQSRGHLVCRLLLAKT